MILLEIYIKKNLTAHGQNIPMHKIRLCEQCKPYKTKYNYALYFFPKMIMLWLSLIITSTLPINKKVFKVIVCHGIQNLYTLPVN